MSRRLTEIRQEWPPNIEKIRAVLPVSERNIFAYGGVIYNPGGGELTSPLIAHERVHFLQQEKLDRWWRDGTEVWWKRFLRDPVFRLDQELEAHRAEYREFLRWESDRNAQNSYLFGLGKRLSAPMYGGIINHVQAMEAIR